MRYYTFAVVGPLGRALRIGAEQGGKLVDLNAACAAFLAERASPTRWSTPTSWCPPT